MTYFSGANQYLKIDMQPEKCFYSPCFSQKKEWVIICIYMAETALHCCFTALPWAVSILLSIII